MSRRSRKYKKQFVCGHRGFGKFCHRCTDKIRYEENKRQALEKRQKERQLWKQSFADDPIDLTGLPKPIVLKARKILSALKQGASFWQFLGKRFSFDRNVIRIPITYRYRLLLQQTENELKPVKILSHEAYNSFSHNKKKI